MTDRHKANPVTFRPPENDRAWLYAYAEVTGRSVGSLLSEALFAYRETAERRKAPVISALPAAVV